MTLTMNQLKQYADFKLLMGEAKDMECDMKATVDAEFEERYLESGDKTRAVLDGGEEIATLTWCPGQAAKEEDVLLVDDPDAYLAWCSDNGFILTDDAAALKWFHDTGEMPEGCALSTKYSGGRSGYVRVTAKKPYKAAFAERARKLLRGEVL